MKRFLEFLNSLYELGQIICSVIIFFIFGGIFFDNNDPIYLYIFVLPLILFGLCIRKLIDLVEIAIWKQREEKERIKIKDFNWLISNANKCYEKKYYWESNELYAKIIVLDPHNPIYHFKRGIGYEFLNELDEALLNYSNSLKFERTTFTLERRANIFEKKGDIQNAIRDWEEASILGSTKSKEKIYEIGNQNKYKSDECRTLLLASKAELKRDHFGTKWQKQKIEQKLAITNNLLTESGEIVEFFFRHNDHFIEIISRYYNLNFNLLEKYLEKWNWNLLSLNENLRWSLDLLERFDAKWNWNLLSRNQTLPWSNHLIQKYQAKWNWDSLSSNNSIVWSADVIEEYQDRINWYNLSFGKTLELSTDIIDTYIEKINWGEYAQGNSSVSCPAGLSLNTSFIWSNNLIDKYLNEWNWTYLSRNKSLNWSVDLIDTYIEKWDWGELIANSELPWSEELIERYVDKWDWNASYIYNSGEFKFGNLNLPWTVELLRRFKEKWNWKQLTENVFLPWSESIIEEFKDKWQWGPDLNYYDSNYGEYLCRGLSMNKSIPWSIELIEKFKDKLSTFNNIHLEYESIDSEIIDYVDEVNRFHGLSLNQNSSIWELETIEKFKYSWNWEYLSSNESLPWSEELIAKYESFWNWKGVNQYDVHWIHSPEDECLKSYYLFHNNCLSSNRNLPWTIEFVEMFKDKWDWKKLSENPSLPWSTEFIEKYLDKWDWNVLLDYKKNYWADELIEKYKDKWNWRKLSENPSLPWSSEFIEKYLDKWDWKLLVRNESISWSITKLFRFEININFGDAVILDKVILTAINDSIIENVMIKSLHSTVDKQTKNGNSLEFDINPKTGLFNEINIIGYIPTDQFADYEYPAVYMTTVACQVKKPQYFDRTVKGITESAFEKQLNVFNDFKQKIFSDRCLFLENRNCQYEPDFCFIDEDINLFIDIEIDEPYFYLNDIGQPVHCIGEDHERNQIFTQNGWIVIRFSESQVHLYPEACCNFIALVLCRLNEKFKMPDLLKDKVGLCKQSFWSKEIAQKFIENREREQYLGRKIGNSDQIRTINNRLTIKVNPSEKRPEEKKLELQHDNEDVENIHLVQTKDLVQEYLESINIKIMPSELACNLLTNSDLNHMPTSSGITEFGLTYFMQIINLKQPSINIFETDKKIIKNCNGVFGLVNLISRNSNGTYSIYKWIPSTSAKQYRYAIDIDSQESGVKADIINSSLEMNICKKILQESEYMVENMYFILYHPVNGGGFFFRALENAKIADQLC